MAVAEIKILYMNFPNLFMAKIIFIINYLFIYTYINDTLLLAIVLNFISCNQKHDLKAS